MNVRITVRGNQYEGTSYEGDICNAPVTILVPEGIVSERTTEEADRLRGTLARALAGHDAVELTAVCWTIRVERI